MDSHCYTVWLITLTDLHDHDGLTLKLCGGPFVNLHVERYTDTGKVSQYFAVKKWYSTTSHFINITS